MKEIIKAGKPRSEVRKVYRFICESCESEFISDEYEWGLVQQTAIDVIKRISSYKPKSQCSNCDYTATALEEYNK